MWHIDSSVPARHRAHHEQDVRRLAVVDCLAQAGLLVHELLHPVLQQLHLLLRRGSIAPADASNRESADACDPLWTQRPGRCPLTHARARMSRRTFFRCRVFRACMRFRSRLCATTGKRDTSKTSFGARECWRCWRCSARLRCSRSSDVNRRFLPRSPTTFPSTGSAGGVKPATAATAAAVFTCSR